YHPYYKAPDLLGPALSTAHGLRYATAEASFSPKRERDDWQPWQAPLRAALGQACVNICFTRRDHDGLSAALPGARLAMLPPFLDRAEMDLPPAPPADRVEIVTVAMMRPGDKLESYRRLAAALTRLPATPDWRLTLIGDGPARAEVEGLLAPLPPGRIRWLGECSPAVVARELAAGTLYLWPGVGEAYGLAYLEAQAAGLPVVAEATAGVPDVVRAGETALLTPPGDGPALSDALRHLMRDPATRARMGENARRFVREERSASAAARMLDQILTASFDGAPT
ncbi:glycosyltransferase, partial [Thioclava sp. BHET1]